MNLPNRPRIVYGVTTLDLSVPCEPWEPEDEFIGGMDKTASGVPVGYIQNTEAKLNVTLRFLESEWPSISAWIRAVITGTSFTFRIDQDDAATAGTYYLEEPSLENGKVRPTRDPQYLGVFRLAVVLRRTTDSVVDFDFMV